jgi:acyl dehydratase
MSQSISAADVHIGQQFLSAPRVISRAEILAFAREFDPQYFHLDDEAARASLFGGLAASGWHVASIAMRLLVESTNFIGGIIGTTAEVAWRRPVRPDDELHLKSEIVALAPSDSRVGRYMATMRSEAINQKGEVAFVLTAQILLHA